MGAFWLLSASFSSLLLVVVNDIVHFSVLGDVRDELDRELASIGVHLLPDLLLLDRDWPQYVLEVLFFGVQVTQWEVEALGREDVELLTIIRSAFLLRRRASEGASCWALSWEV